MAEKKKCFIITPIGGENEPIRRHIEGIIDAAIIPALGENYDVTVAHRINVSGTITKQVIEEIYNADLVIANLTGKNPNVMYELAFRHCLGTPLITIADKETSLPADIVSERTIFYYNDAKGVLELQEKLESYLKEIDFEQKSSPILDALSDITKTNNLLEITQQGNTDDDNALNLIIRKLNYIESSLEKNNSTPPPVHRTILRFEFESAPEDVDVITIVRPLRVSLARYAVKITSINRQDSYIRVVLKIQDPFVDLAMVSMEIIDMLTQNGFSGVRLSGSQGRVDA